LRNAKLAAAAPAGSKPPRPVSPQCGRYPTLLESGIQVGPQRNAELRHKFTPSQKERMCAQQQAGATQSSEYESVFQRLAQEFSTEGAAIEAHRIQIWFRNHPLRTSTKRRRESSTHSEGCESESDDGGTDASHYASPLVVPEHMFSESELSLLRVARAAGVTHTHRFNKDIKALAERFRSESLPGSRVCYANDVRRWFQLNPMSSVVGCDMSYSHVRFQLSRTGGQSRRVFSVAEVAYLRDVQSKGVDRTIKYMRLFEEIAKKFTVGTNRVCRADQVMAWFRNSPLPTAAAAASSSVVAPASSASALLVLPPFVETGLPRHSNRPSGRNRRRDAPTAINHATTIDSSLDHFWETSGLWQNRNFRIALTESAATSTAEERAAALAAEMRRPVSDEVRTKAISQYNQYMDPHTPLLLCSSCGVYEFNSLLVPLENHGPSGEESLRLALPVCVNEVLYDTPIRLTPEQVDEHLSRPHLYRDCYSVMRVRDAEHIIERNNIERSLAGGIEVDSDVDSDLNYSYYHLNSQLSYVDVQGRVMIRMCTMCSVYLAQSSKKPKQRGTGTASDVTDLPAGPPYSIASSCDFGRPSMLNLPQLSTLEVQLIACYRVFGNVVKLVAPFGLDKSTRQSAFSGHTIVFPHDGPAVCATKLPNMASIHESVSIMFIGTKAQWTAKTTRPTLMQQFQSIFQVRGWAVLKWLKALKGVCNRSTICYRLSDPHHHHHHHHSTLI
jgi:hypothetical protein